MNNRKLYIALGVFSAVCAVFALAGSGIIVSEVLLGGAYIRLGELLREMSLRGGIWNGVATVCYTILCLLPLILGGKGLVRGKRENWLLAAMTAALFPVLYLMINPGFLSGQMGDMGVTVMLYCLSNCCSGILLAWAVFRVLRVTRETESLRVFRVLLWILAAVLCYTVCYISLLGLPSKLEGDMTQTLFALLSFAVGTLPYVLDVLLVLRGEALLAAFETDRHSEETAAHAETLSRLAALSLKLTVLVSLGYNILQLMFSSLLRDVNVNLNIPLLPLALALAALLLSRLIRENKDLKDESDMFI